MFLRLMKGAERATCVDCHSQLAMRYMHEDEIVYITLGTVNEGNIRDETVKEALRPRSHIFASQNPWWYNISMDGLPAHDRFGGEYEEKMIAWVKEHNNKQLVDCPALKTEARLSRL